MKKLNETIKINGKSYTITQAKDKSVRCRICQEHNRCIPCFNPDPRTDKKSDWSKNDCDKSIPNDCYLKPEN